MFDLALCFVEVASTKKCKREQGARVRLPRLAGYVAPYVERASPVRDG